jgi:hypothetical protein
MWMGDAKAAPQISFDEGKCWCFGDGGGWGVKDTRDRKGERFILCRPITDAEKWNLFGMFFERDNCILRVCGS